MILGDFCWNFRKKNEKIQKIENLTEKSIFGPFWGVGGSYPGGKNLPLPILHRFAPSKDFFFTKYRVIFRVGGRSPKIPPQMAGPQIESQRCLGPKKLFESIAKVMAKS